MSKAVRGGAVYESHRAGVASLGQPGGARMMRESSAARSSARRFLPTLMYVQAMAAANSNWVVCALQRGGAQRGVR